MQARAHSKLAVPQEFAESTSKKGLIGFILEFRLIGAGVQCFVSILLPSKHSQKVESEEKLILSHIRRISCFKIKHILRFALCTPLTLVHCLGDDVMKASKSIFPKTLPARMEINTNLGRDGTASDSRVCGKKRFRHIKFPIAFVNTRDVL